MITKDLLDSIASRSDMLSRRYYFLEKEDLLQEGYIFLMDLEKKQLSDLQKHKAINNKFSNVERAASSRQKIEKNVSSFEPEPFPLHYESEADTLLEREDVTNKLLNKLSHQEIVIVEWLSQGWTLDKIAATLGVERDRVYKLVNQIVKKRGELENV